MPPPSTPQTFKQTAHKLSSFISIDESSPTYLGAGSDARSLTVVSATLGGAAILFGRPFVAEEIQSQTAGGASATSALWTLCIRNNEFKAVQLRVTSSGGNLYAIAVQAGYQSADADCGTWPLDHDQRLAGGFTANGYGVASLGYMITVTVYKLSSFVSIDESSPTYLGAGSDARSLTVVSATLGGAAILFGRPFVAEEIQSQTAGGASATSALWTLCIRNNEFKAVQLRVTSSGGNLYAIAVQAGYQSADADCGTWPLDHDQRLAGGFTANGYGVASLGYMITA